ncbi:response regulator transcription factor [Cohnella soli]|uniref:Response regulator n=1 Tax=Cohnella soli TaxID=425005 RepID=A0ABW0HYH9_9BACL
MYSVVLVDDNPIITEALVCSIGWHRFGFEVARIFDDGEEALEYIVEHEPDVVITDIRMPKMDGIELARRLKQLNLSVHVIVLSAYSDFSYAQSLIRYGGYGYLLKPLDEEELETMLGELARKLSPPNDESMANPPELSETIVERAKAYAKQHLHEPISLDDVAEGIHLSKNYFCNVFKAETGLTFWDYLTQIRIEKAKELLQTDMKTYEIAYTVGYENASYLSKVFKKAHGITPSEYRKKRFPQKKWE